MMRNTLQNLLYNNNYDQPDTSAAAFNTLPIIIQQQLLQQQRIVLIANNPSINTASLEALLQPTDMLVLFNDFIHADFFANNPIVRDLPKLLFFRQIGDSALHFGLPPRSNNLTAMLDMAKQAPLGILFGNTDYQFPLPADDPNPNDDPITASRILDIPKLLNDLLHSDEHCRVLSEQHSVYRPPLNHLDSIVMNANRFYEKWQHWPMSGWLAEFAQLQLIDWRDTQTVPIGINRQPSDAEIIAAHYPDAPYV